MTAPAHEAQAPDPTTSHQPLWQSRSGWIVGVDGAGHPVVDYEGNPHGPQTARTLVSLEPAVRQATIDNRTPIELRFENGDTRLPIIVALAEGPASPSILDTLLEDAHPTEEESVHVIQGRDELVLKCGKASITLRRNGRIIIKGTYVETYSEGVNRLKGCSIQMN